MRSGTDTLVIRFVREDVELDNGETGSDWHAVATLNGEPIDATMASALKRSGTCERQWHEGEEYVERWAIKR